MHDMRGYTREWLRLGVSVAICLLSALAASAQDGSAPLPGSDSVAPLTPTVPETIPVPASPAMPQTAPPRQTSASPVRPGYSQLPLSIKGAQSRLEELRSLLAVSPPQSLQEAVNHLAEWLADMTDAHNKMAQAFGKHEGTKAEAQAERQMAGKFSQLKNRAELLKADILIKEGRLPEALAPLVAIVVSEPETETGQDAYRRLKDIGFSEAAPAAASAQTKENAQVSTTPRLAPAPKWQARQTAMPVLSAKVKALKPKMAVPRKIAAKRK